MSFKLHVVKGGRLLLHVLNTKYGLAAVEKRAGEKAVRDGPGYEARLLQHWKVCGLGTRLVMPPSDEVFF